MTDALATLPAVDVLHPGRAVRQITLFLPTPRGEARPATRREPLQGRFGTYPHPKTVLAMRRWQDTWVSAGQPFVEGPVILEVYIRVLRPPSHLLKSGEVNAEGRKHLVPGGFDVSNVIKLVEDALKQRAFGDDALVYAVHARKSWGSPTARPPGVEVHISSMRATAHPDADED